MEYNEGEKFNVHADWSDSVNQNDDAPKSAKTTASKKKVMGVDYDVQASSNGDTVWVHSGDGSTVGRFSKAFGMDVHTTVTEQMGGKGQCLACTHEKATKEDWLLFCSLIEKHYAIPLSTDLIRFGPENDVKQAKKLRPD